MKKIRRIFFVIVIFTPLAIIITHQAWKFFEFNQRLVEYVRSELIATFGDELEVEEITFGLGSLHFENLVYKPQDESFRIWIEEARLDYDSKAFIKEGFNFDETDKQVFISKPRLTISSSMPKNGILQKPDETRLIETLVDVSEALSGMKDWTKFIQFNAGELFLEDDRNAPARQLLKEIYGSSIIVDNQKNDVVFVASLRENEQSVRFDCRVDLEAGEIDSLLFSAKYVFDKEVDLGEKTGIVLRDGAMSVSVSLMNQPDEHSYGLHGKVFLQDGEAFLKKGNLTFEDIDIEASVANDSVKILSGACYLNGSKIELSGDLKNLIEPQLWITLKSYDFSPKSWIEKLTPDSESLVSGRGELELLLSGTIDQPAFHGVFQSDSLFFQDLHLEKAIVNVSLIDSVLSFERAVAQNRFNRIEGEGDIFFNGSHHTISAMLKTEGDFTPVFEALRLERLSGAQGKITAQVKGRLNSPRFDGAFSLMLPTASQERLGFNGDFEIENWDISFNTQDQFDRLFAQGSITNTLEKPHFDFEINDLTTAAKLLRFPVPNYFADRYRLETSVLGSPSDLSLRIRGVGLEEEKPFLISTLELKENGKNTGSVTGKLSLYPERNEMLSTSFAASYDEKLLNIYRIGDGKWVTGQAKVELVGGQNVDGEINLQDLELEEISTIDDSTGLKIVTGRAFGKVKLSGKLREPVAEIDGGIFNGYYKGAGIYDVVLSANIDRKGFRLDRFLINESQQPFLALSGEITNSPRKIDFTLSGQNIDINHLLFTLSTRDSVVLGRADVDIKLRGDKWPLATYGSVNVRDGQALWFSFDELRFDLGDENNGHSFLSDDGWRVGGITFRKSKKYVMRGSGVFPLNKQDSARIELKGSGDFLSTLSDFTQNVTQTYGYGELDLKLGGPYKRMRLMDSQLNISNGRIHLNQVADKITDIEAKLVTRGRFVEIVKLDGKIGGKKLSLTNYEYAPVRRGNLGAPLILNRDWMSLGTLQLNSEPGGVPLYIPGLMQPGEVGNFHFKGRSKAAANGTALPSDEEQITRDEPGFFIAGPWGHPVFRGDVVLNKVDLTYPFIESSDSSNAVILNILMNADWDVAAIAGKDNRYVKELKYGISNFYVNLGLNDAVSRLHFTGVVRDTSTFVPLEVEKDLAAKSGSNQTNGHVIQRPANGRGDMLEVQDAYTSRWKEIRKQLVEDDTSSFRIAGQVESTRGTIEYFDLDFRIDKFSAAWDRSSLEPILNGTAWTTIYNDTLERSDHVYLKLLARDPETGALKQRARLEDVYLEIESDNQYYNYSKVNLLSILGVKFNNLDDIREQATEFLTMNTERIVFRNLLRPVERKLRSSLGLDVVRLHSRFTRNFLEINDNSRTDLDLALTIFRSSKVTLGKYLSNRMYFLYTGQIDTWPVYNTLETPNIGFRHTLGFEFRINPSLLLQMQYDYNNALASPWKEDKRIWLRHSFPF